MTKAKGKTNTKARHNNRQDYIDAAMAIIAAAGVDKLSMRNVADHMGVSAMAMYKHFANKNELLAAVLDEFISRADVFPDDGLPWDEWVLQMGRGMFAALCAEISWVPLLGAIRIGPTAVGVMESFVGKLISAGFSTEDACEAFFAVIHTVVGAVSMQSSLQFHHQKAVSEPDEWPSSSFDERPEHRQEFANAMLTVLQKPQIEIGLPILIAALQSKLMAPVGNHTPGLIR